MSDQARLDYTNRWRLRMKAEGRCVTCGKIKERPNNQLCDYHARKRTLDATKNKNKVKVECFNAYGGCACYCCGETILDFLGLDHINNDGNKEARSGKSLYYQLRRQGWPSGFRVACHNCNLGRHLNGGICPHQKLKTSQVA